MASVGSIASFPPPTPDHQSSGSERPHPAVARIRPEGMGASAEGSEFQFGKMKEFWCWMVAMVAQPCKFT